MPPRTPPPSLLRRRLVAVGRRVRDIAGASALLMATAPLLAAAAAAVVVTTGRPAFFSEDRCGLHERPFRILKLRTMRGPAPDPPDPSRDAERTTALGRLLRRTSLDELPQLINVLRGDMSLVGPRPLYLGYLDHYDARQRRRHEVRPGMTGLAQVSGRADLGWEATFELDVRYVENPDLLLDLWILARTLGVVCTGRGVEPGRARPDRLFGQSMQS